MAANRCRLEHRQRGRWQRLWTRLASWVPPTQRDAQEAEKNELNAQVDAALAKLKEVEREVSKVASDPVEESGVPLSSFAYDPKQARAEAEQQATSGGHPGVTGAESSANSDEAQMASNSKAKVKTKANGQAKREKVPKQVRKCICGCGSDTQGFFAPGHDSRFHGWIAKLADGRMEPKDIPQSVRNGLNLQKTKTGYRAQNPNYFKQA